MIETERLILRPYELGDFEPYCAMISDPARPRTPWTAVISREDAWNRVLRWIGHWQAFGFGMIAILEKQGGRFVGETGLAHFGRGLGEGFDGTPEASWSIASWAQKQGYASEATDAAHRWHDARHGEARTVCLIHPANEASLRVAARLGYRGFGDVVYRSEPSLMLERARGKGTQLQERGA